MLVDNEFGVLARVIGLFSGRGYNIESLTVAEIEHGPDKDQGGRSRITIVTSGTERVVEQIKKLLEKMVPVYKVHDLTVEGPHVERELALVKVAGRWRSDRVGSPARRRHFPRPRRGLYRDLVRLPRSPAHPEKIDAFHRADAARSA